MVVKIYISAISGNKEVKKRQQRVMMILDSKSVQYDTIDITEPGKEEEKEFMQTNSDPKDNRHPLPPQIFNDFDYCGDYEDFDLANENDELEKFLKLLPDSTEQSLNSETRQNGNTTSREVSTEKEMSVAEDDSKDERQLSTEEKTKSEEDKEESEEGVDINEEKSDDQEKEE